MHHRRERRTGGISTQQTGDHPLAAARSFDVVRTAAACISPSSTADRVFDPARFDAASKIHRQQTVINAASFAYARSHAAAAAVSASGAADTSEIRERRSIPACMHAT